MTAVTTLVLYTDASPGSPRTWETKYPLYARSPKFYRQKLANYGPWAKSSPLIVFVNKILSEYQFVYVLSMATFVLQRQNGIVTRETLVLAIPKIFSIWPFTEKVCRPVL